MDTARYVFETRQKEDPKSVRDGEGEGGVRASRRPPTTRAAAASRRRRRPGTRRRRRSPTLEKTKKDAEEALAKLDEEYDRYQAKLKTLRQDDAFYFVRNAPIADMLAPSLKIQQVQLDGLSNDVNFLRSQRVDRCVTCHIAAEKRGFEDKQKYPESVLRTHPRLDLFVDSNSPHPYATFGCTSCHGGRDRATDFTRAGHMPNDYAAYEKLEEELHTGRDEKGMPVDEDALRELMEETQTGPLDEGVRLGGRQVQRPPDVPDEGRRGGVLPLPPAGRGPPEGARSSTRAASSSRPSAAGAATR